MEGTDPRNKAEIVIGMPAGIAGLAPAADVAVRHRARIRCPGRRRRDVFFQALPDQAVVGAEVVESKALPGEPLARLHHVHQGRRMTQQPRHHVGVQAELEDGPGARLLGELRICHLVGPLSEVTRLRDPDEEIGPAGPAPVSELRLHDHPRACSHGCGRFLQRKQVSVSPQIDHVLTLGAEVLHVCSLVRQSPFLQERKRRISPGRGGNPPLGNAAIELRQVPAGEVVRDVGGGQPQRRPFAMHGPYTIVPW